MIHILMGLIILVLCVMTSAVITAKITANAIKSMEQYVNEVCQVNIEQTQKLKDIMIKALKTAGINK